mmetsp:Transcript_87817/g.256687  ORF Transcript_87817/g.256687 Transcript_87817/m.256687 type:complete len:343 (-) Transcript_87817:136-1164(-)
MQTIMSYTCFLLAVALPARALQVPELRQPGPTAARESYCGHGKLLPELYVLGPMSTATSSLWLDISKAGFITAPDNRTKEWNFFWSSAGTPVNEMYENWFSSLAPCPQERAVMVDLSVTNIATVPSPPDLALVSKVAPKWNAPALISRFHREVSDRDPHLMVMLRDPLVRIHSEYYFYLKSLRWTEGRAASSTFARVFAADVALLDRRPPLVAESLWKSLTARGVEAYLGHFPAARFMFVPMSEYTQRSANFSAGLFKRLGIQADPWEAASHTNERTHRPALDEELPPSSPARRAYEAFMAPEIDRLVSLLADAHAQGAWLAGYEGEVGNRSEVRRWLLAGW